MMLKLSLKLMMLTSPSRLVVTMNSSPYRNSQLRTTDSFSKVIKLIHLREFCDTGALIFLKSHRHTSLSLPHVAICVDALLYVAQNTYTVSHETFTLFVCATKSPVDLPVLISHNLAIPSGDAVTI
jgi:hypothetical protein